MRHHLTPAPPRQAFLKEMHARQPAIANGQRNFFASTHGMRANSRDTQAR